MQRAQEGDIVRIHVGGRRIDGSEFELSPEPQDIIIGHGDLLPDVERALIGMTPGESRVVIVPKRKGYAERRDDLVQEIPRDAFPKNVVPKVGLRVRIPMDGYEVIDAVITEVTDSMIILDGNHPLAGEDVMFNITLFEIVQL